MPCFLYFLPGATGKPTPDQLAAAGLAYAFEGPPVARGVTAGPDGCAGQVLADAAHVDPLAVGYWPDRQTWTKHPDAAGAWLGLATDAEPPGPADLARRGQLAGHAVTLADGNAWLVPVARGLAGDDADLGYYVALPRCSALDENGQWVQGGILPRWAGLWQTALAWWDAKGGATLDGTADGPAVLSLDFAGQHDAAALALGANYRIGKAEAAALGLFTAETVREILDALVDWPTLVRWVETTKKKDTPPTPEASRPPAGPPVSPRDTGPPWPTSGPSPSASTAPTPSP